MRPSYERAAAYALAIEMALNMVSDGKNYSAEHLELIEAIKTLQPLSADLFKGAESMRQARDGSVRSTSEEHRK